MPYATTEKVKLVACVSAGDLNKTDVEFDNLLATLITWVTGEINACLGRSYTDAELTASADLQATLESVTVQAVDNYLLTMLQRKTTPIITVNDFAVRTPPRVILTDDMKVSLERWRSYPGVQYESPAERFASSKSGLFAVGDVL